jgi:cobalt-zinc-cadmium efflux system protein
LNVKGAYFEVLGDMLGSIGVIIAALLMMWKGWRLADPIIGAGIGLFIVPRTWVLLKQVTNILMEGTPAHVDVAAMQRQLLANPRVKDVHDLHVWTITSGVDAMSCHLVVDDMGRGAGVIREARALAKKDFKVDHITVQVEDEALRSEFVTLHV